MDADISAHIASACAASGLPIAATYVFGSVARGEAGPASDLDVAVLLTREPEPTLEGIGLGLADRLEASIGRPIDLTVLNRAPVDLIHRVLLEGDLVFEHDRSARIQFEVRARNDYFDLLPVLEEYRRTGRATG